MADTGASPENDADKGSRQPDAWPVLIPSLIAFLCLLPLFGLDAVAGIYVNPGASGADPAPQPADTSWVGTDFKANLLLGLVAIATVVIGVLIPRLRRTAIIAGWLVTPAAVAIFVLAVH